MFISKALHSILKTWVQMPSWMRWAGGLCLAAGYSFLFYYFFVSPTGFRWRAIYGDPDYPEGYTIYGIDVSRYQGTINWNRLRNAMIDRSPIRFIIIKSTEGDSHVDVKFRDNFYNAKESGFIRGVYHFWSNNSSARRQAYFFLAMVHLQPGDRYHVKPIIYTYYKFKDQYLSDSRFDDYPYWIAHYYVNQMEYQGAWKFWQHTDAGRLPGIKGYVDLDIYNGSFYDLQQLLIPQEVTNVQATSNTSHDSTNVDSLLNQVH